MYVLFRYNSVGLYLNSKILLQFLSVSGVFGPHIAALQVL